MPSLTRNPTPTIDNSTPTLAGTFPVVSQRCTHSNNAASGVGSGASEMGGMSGDERDAGGASLRAARGGGVTIDRSRGEVATPLGRGGIGALAESSASGD